MCRYTALRTLLILAAVLRPLLALAGFLCLAADKIGLWLPAFSISFMLVSSLPALCLDPAVEEAHEQTQKQARQQRAKSWRENAGQLCFVVLLLVIQLMSPELILKSFALLWDWRPVTVVTLLCMLWLRRELRAALAFKPVHLYPNLKREAASGCG